MGNLWSRGKFDKCKFTVSYRKDKLINKHINWLCTCFYPIWTCCEFLYESSFRNGSWRKHRRMGPKVKQIILWTQAIKWKLVWSSKIGLERRCYPQYQVDPCVFYRKYLIILTYDYDFVTVSHKQETIKSLIESLRNGLENYVLVDEWDISNYLGVKIKKNHMGHSNYHNRTWWGKL